MNFASDNNAGVAPEILARIEELNAGYRGAYGNDELTEAAKQSLREAFEAPDAAVYFVPTGTAANALALACLSKPWEKIFCHRLSHIEEDECGAVEFFTGGARLALVEGHEGKMALNDLRTKIAQSGLIGVHNMQRGAISLTNVTECGTVYSLEQMRQITEIGREFGLRTHLDGARFANAMIHLGATPAEMSWKVGIDAVSFGATKNGCLAAEAVILFDPELAWEFELRRKRAGHLFSKHRYLSAQILAYLENGLWRRLAADANRANDRLVEGIRAAQNHPFLYPPQANMCFANFTRKTHKTLAAAGAHYHPWPADQDQDGRDDELVSCRLVASWSTTDAEIDAFVEAL